MGQDKALLHFPANRPMAEEVAEALSAICSEVFIVRRTVTEGHFSWPVLFDEDGSCAHPLWGVACALRAAQGQPILIAPCDTPFVQPASLKKLRPSAHEDGRVAVCEGRKHPLIAGLSPSLLSHTLRCARSNGSVRRWAEGFAQVSFSPSELINVNHPVINGEPHV